MAHLDAVLLDFLAQCLRLILVDVRRHQLVHLLLILRLGLRNRLLHRLLRSCNHSTPPPVTRHTTMAEHGRSGSAVRVQQQQ